MFGSPPWTHFELLPLNARLLFSPAFFQLLTARWGCTHEGRNLCPGQHHRPNCELQTRELQDYAQRQGWGITDIYHLNYARRGSRWWLVEGAAPFGTPENSALKQ